MAAPEHSASPDGPVGPLNDPAIFEGYDRLRLDTPWDCVRHLAVSVLTIAEIEEDFLATAQGAKAEVSVFAAKPTGSYTYTVPGTFKHEVVYEYSRQHDQDTPSQAVTVKRLPLAPDYDGVGSREAVARVEEYERQKAKTPFYHWSDLGGIAVARVAAGVRTPLTVTVPMDLLVSSATIVREAAVDVAFARGRKDKARELLPSSDEA